MRINLTNADHLRDLLRFLRARGCIAYATGDSHVIEAFRADTAGAVEDASIHELLETWLAANPTATPQLERP
jgi:hypothetical protein